MQQLFTLIPLIAATPSTNEKKELISQFVCKESLNLIKRTFDTSETFGIKKIKMPKEFRDDGSIGFKEFSDLLDSLQARRLTGNEARDSVTETLSRFNENHAKILAGVIQKDLKCRATATLFNNVFPDLIPVFKVQLAKKLTDVNAVKYPVISDYKYDGTRTVAFVTKGQPVVYRNGRSGLIQDHLVGLFDEELYKFLEFNGQTSIVLDGEVMGDTFASTIKSKKTDDTEFKSQLKFFIFDIIEDDDNKTIQLNRLDIIKEIIDQNDFKLINKTNWIVARNKQELEESFNVATERGFEGLIIKDPFAFYSPDRTNAWVKWKPVLSFDGVITEVEKGEGEFSEGMMGALTIEGVDENGTPFIANVGTGFNHKERKDLWANRGEIIGLTIEVEAQEMTLAENATVHSLRFPAFVKFRPDKD